MGKDDLLSRVGATGAAAERWPATHRKESKAAIPQRRWPFVLFSPFPFPFASPVQSPLTQTRPRPCLHPPFRPPAPRKRSLLAPLRASRNHRDHGSISINDDSRSIQSCDSPSAAHFCRLWSLTLSRAVAQDGTPVSLPTPALPGCAALPLRRAWSDVGSISARPSVAPTASIQSNAFVQPRLVSCPSNHQYRPRLFDLEFPAA